ncbi:phage-shock protein, partial [Vibrio xuii]
MLEALTQEQIDAVNKMRPEERFNYCV